MNFVKVMILLALLPIGNAQASTFSWNRMTCTTPVGELRSQNMEGVWESVEATTQIGVTDDAREMIELQFCIAVREIIDERTLDQNRIEGIIPAAFGEYVRGLVREGQRSATAKGILHSKLGIPGFGRPQIKPLGSLIVTPYDHLSRIDIDFKSHDPMPRYVLAPGSPEVIGYDEHEEVACRQTVKIKKSIETTMPCKDGS